MASLDKKGESSTRSVSFAIYLPFLSYTFSYPTLLMILSGTSLPYVSGYTLTPYDYATTYRRSTITWRRLLHSRSRFIAESG